MIKPQDTFEPFQNQGCKAGMHGKVEQRCSGVASTIWPTSAASSPNLSALCCYLVKDTGGRHCPDCLAETILGPKEQHTWQELGRSEKRRRQWLLGRLAAKKAVSQFLKDRLGLELPLSHVDILKTDQGRPIVGKLIRDKLIAPLSISIAHSGPYAVGLAGIGTGLGIDIEPLDSIYEGFEKIVLTLDEGAIIHGLPDFGRNEWLMRLWCAKEAVVKAIGIGMVGGPHNIVTLKMEPSSGKVRVVLKGALGERVTAHSVTQTAYTGFQDGLVFAVCRMNTP
jgi:phosphopantetheinyl transferase